MIAYKLKSISILDLYNELKSDKLISNAYFQRNLVWREIHKREFIETILKGYPFPQMFFSRGKINVQSMSTVSCIVDGQQRTAAIKDFIENKIPVLGTFFKDLSDEVKSTFLKYDIAVVELDLDNDNPEVTEIFKRLNRTSNSLTIIEKLASEYASTDYMYVTRLLANDIDLQIDSDRANNDEADWRNDPNMSIELITWAKTKEVSNFSNLITSLEVFTSREIARKVHLIYLLNIMTTILGGFFNRNDRTIESLEDYKEEFPQANEIYDVMIQAIKYAQLLNINKNDFWTRKANFYSLVIAIGNTCYDKKNINVSVTKDNLVNFSNAIPDDYALAAREGVNNKAERELRNAYITNLIVTA